MSVIKSKLKNRKGVGLVEVLVATAILVLVAATTLIFLSHGSLMQRTLRGVIENNFELVHDMELQIREVRILLDDLDFVDIESSLDLELPYPIDRDVEVQLLGYPNADGILLFEDLFSINHISNNLPASGGRVKIYLLRSDLGLGISSGNNRFYSFMGQRGIRYPAPEVVSLYIEFDESYRSQPILSPLANVLSYYHPNLSAGTRETPIFYPAEGTDIWGGVNYQWWVSRPGFGTIIPPNTDPDGHIFDEEMDDFWGRYPSFPEDFEQILGATHHNVLPSSFILPSFRGRHIVLSATPFSNLGRMGTMVRSNSLLIPGVPIDSGLFLHLDAGAIDRTVPGNYIDEDRNVKRWNDLINSDLSYSAEHFGGAYAILNFEESDFPNRGDVQFSVIEFRSDIPGSGDQSPHFSLNRAGHSSDPDPDSGGIGMTIFVVARQHETLPPNYSNAIIRGISGSTNWTLGFDRFSINHQGASVTVESYDPHEQNEFYVVSTRFGVDPTTSQVLVSHGLNDQIETSNMSVANAIVNFETIQIGSISPDGINFGRFDASIAEIIIFNRYLDDDEYNRVLNFLFAQYNIM